MTRNPEPTAILAIVDRSHSLVSFDNALIHRIQTALRDPAGGGLSDEFLEVVGNACETLAKYVPWTEALVGMVSKSAKKIAAKKKFSKLMCLVLGFVLDPGTSLNRLSNPREISDIAKALLGIDIDLELANDVIKALPIVLRHQVILQTFDNPETSRYFAFILKRYEDSLKQTDSSKLVAIQRTIGDGVEAAMEYLDEPDDDAVTEILNAICVAAQTHMERPSRLDANVMLPLDVNEESRAACRRNQDAFRTFGEMLNQATGVLFVQRTTHREYDDFWVPYISDVRCHMPGAAAAYRTAVPEAVFTRFRLCFGTSITPDQSNRIASYLAILPFPLFLSLPIRTSGGCFGVVNINVHSDEIQFHDRERVQALYEGVRPMLSVLRKLILRRPLHCTVAAVSP